jgi:hypothetical protein
VELFAEKAAISVSDPDTIAETATAFRIAFIACVGGDATTYWRNYEPWLGPLKSALRLVLDA